jgi:uncharacterized lipoprotein YddW (UPF0748 family)
MRMVRHPVWFFLVLAATFVPAGAQPVLAPDAAPQELVIDDGRYATNAAAQGAWQPMAGSAQVALANLDGQPCLKMPCNFKGTAVERASWDKGVHLDLSDARGIRLQVRCAEAAAVSHFVLYLHSGGGWYAAPFGVPGDAGWSTITIDKSDTDMEDIPGGWGKIDAIRLSAWRGGDQDTVLYLRGLTATRCDQRPQVVLVRGESVAATAKDELGTVCEFTAAVAAKLDELGLRYGMMSDLDLTPERLQGETLVILPHNPAMPAGAVQVLANYLRSGGKMLVFYVLPPGLRDAAGIAGGEHVPQKRAGQFASIRAAKDGPIAELPAQTAQMSWNISAAKPVEGRSRVAAEWFDAGGRPSGYAAIVASDNCVQMTHVLLADDAANKRRLVMALAGYLAPQLWREAADASVGGIGRLGPYSGLDDAERQIRARIGPGHDAATALEKAGALQTQAQDALRRKQYVQAIDLAGQADGLVRDAACTAQTAAKGEHRAFWCHSAFGVEGMDWDQAIHTLSDNGFNAIMVNMLWGGTAYYPSTVLPVAPQVQEKGDQVAQCLSACRKYGVACHIWKVDWNMGGVAPPEFAQRMRDSGRTQVDDRGKPIPQWLCPSHPDNQKLEVDALVEVATKYDVDGIHFDYIRYPGPEACFCAGCRARFEKAIGAKVANWPQDLKKDEALKARWLDFRRQNITHVVAEVSAAVRRVRPAIKVSAAVFANWPVDRDGVGQDWADWCAKGYLDFVCPMDYTPDTASFKSRVSRQMKWAGKAGCYPGIGLSTWGAKGDVFTLLDQINATRAAGAGGFTIFNYSRPEAMELVPLCGKGITRKP